MIARLTPILFGILCILVASAFVVSRLRPVEGVVDSGDAVAIAGDNLQSSPHVERVDTTRVSVTYRDGLEAYVVDFAWKGAGEIRPGLWAVGYYVVVDERSGQVREAYAYER
jgi:hypothetical protein